MRTLLIAVFTLLLGVTTTPAEAQRLARNSSGYGSGSYGMVQRQGTTIGAQARQQRWGGNFNGRWHGGMRAPGGWNAYRRPMRGWTLPRYWIAPSFFISDFSSYGLSSPPRGYSWTRYYDDAVMVDQRGQVWDSVSGLDWDRYEDRYDDGRSSGDDDYGSAGGAGGGYGEGYSSAPPPSYGASYGQQEHQRYGYQRQPPVVYAPPSEVVQQGYSESSYGSSSYGSSSHSAGGYASGGYWYPAATTTTVTVQSAPVETVTTTEYVEETTRYVAPRRVYRAKKKVWRPKARSQCQCNCVCR